jgi:hypothetical protein
MPSVVISHFTWANLRWLSFAITLMFGRFLRQPRLHLDNLNDGLWLHQLLDATTHLMNNESAAQEAARTIASGLTCNIDGIPHQERARYERLVQALRNAVQERRELSDGYAFQMDTKQIGTDQLVKWIELERRCCPFFGFEVHWDQQKGAVWLYLTGPEGVKNFILNEFGLR